MFDAKFAPDAGTPGELCPGTTAAIPGPSMRYFIRLLRFCTLMMASLLLLAGGPGAAAAQGIVKRGDAAVTGFSGSKAEDTVPDDVHPLDRTFIDPDGASLRVFDLSDLGTAPRGQVSDAPALLSVKARDTGQVFGVTLAPREGGQTADIYATATSMFGLQIVSDDGNGNLNRLLQGAPGARWMAGQFGPGGTPGSIYRIDGVTGAISLFAKVQHEGRDNAGPGLGNIAFDAKTQQLFVSDLETGLIHRFTLDGKDTGKFDHGAAGRSAQGLDAVAYDPARRMNIESPSFDSEDTATWGFADERRRVFGLSVNRGRLYYAVAEGPAVWSVSLGADGGFGSDARIELEIADTPAGFNITSITFDGAGMMYLAQRGAPSGSYDYAAFSSAGQARLLRYRWDDTQGRWREAPEEYAVGLSGEFRSTLGGVALNYGYDKYGRIDMGKCRQTVWTTGENLRDGVDVARVSTGGARTLHGLQGMYKSRVRPQNEPPFESWFADYDGREDAPDTYGQVGTLAIYAPCDGTPEPATGPFVTPEVIGLDPPLDDPGLVIDKRCYGGAPGGKIRCTIEVRNLMDSPPSEDVRILDVTRILVGPGAGGIVPIVAVDVPFPTILCAALPAADFNCTIPASLLGPGAVIAIDVWVDTHDLTLAGNLGIRNCALLKHPQGFGKACAETGTGIVVEKIGPGTCDAGGACKFGLRIANAGLMPYNGDVLLADAMFIGGGVPNVPVTSVVPPIACSAGNTAQLPFTCVAPLSLMPGEEVIHWVEVTMPAPGGYVAENCFGALDPALLAIAPAAPGLIGGGTGNPSCVPVVVPAPIQPVQASPDPKPPVTLIKLPRCEDGRLRRADGTCPCPRGTRWNEREDACEHVRPRCSDPERRKDDGSCCPRGTYVDSETGRCRSPDPVCPDPDRRRNDGTCCPRGTFVSDNGKRCVGIENGCPPGMRWNYATYTCMPLVPVPVCGYGERYDWRKRICVPVGESCPPSKRYDPKTRSCEERGISCPAGTHWSRSRYTCVPNDGGASCPDGSPRLATGGCRCPLNKRWSALSKSCEGTQTLPGNCLPGERHINGRCVRTGITDDPTCPRGQNRVGKTCVPGVVVPPKVTGPDCGAGQTRVGSRCIRLPDPPKVIVPPKVVPNLPIKPDRPRITPKTELPKFRPEVNKPQIKVPPTKIKPPVRITPTTPKVTPKAQINRGPGINKLPMNKAPINKAPMNMPKLNLR